VEEDEELESTFPTASLVSEVEVLVFCAVRGLFVNWIRGAAVPVTVRLPPLEIIKKSPVWIGLLLALRSGPARVSVVGTVVEVFES
jgi:hypothetical protein